jgi:hypothetical protein
MVSNWEQRVGPMEATMHWASDQMYGWIHRANTRDLASLQLEFTRRRFLDPVTTGVMEVFFVSSCFQLPRVKAMGQRFYALANRIILLSLTTTDDLNLMLYDVVLPQTVIMLEAHTYHLDSFHPPITVALTIQGCRTEQGSTSLVIYCQSALKVWSKEGIRFYDIDFAQGPSSAVAPADWLLDICGDRWCNPVVHLSCVTFSGAGFKVTDVGSLYCNFVAVDQANVGVCMDHVRDIIFVGSNDKEVARTTHAGFENCELAMRATDCYRLSIAHQTYGDCKSVFDMCLRETCLVRDSIIDECNKLGCILMAGCRCPVFTNVQVDQGIDGFSERCLCIASDIYPIVYLANLAVWEFDTPDQEDMDESDENPAAPSAMVAA